MQLSRPSSAVTPSGPTSSLSSTTPAFSSSSSCSRPSSAGSLSRQTLTTPIPEVIVVAEKLDCHLDSLDSCHGCYNDCYQASDEGVDQDRRGLEGYKYRVVDECNNSKSNNSKAKTVQAKEYKHKLKRKLRDHLPDEWDLESTSSLESNLYTLNENIRTISHLITKDESTEKLFHLEPRPHGKLVTCIFATCYFSLGATIVVVIVMTILYDFGMLMLLCLLVSIFIIIVILTNICVIVYQQ